MSTLITGSDGSLGSTLCQVLKKCCGIDNGHMKEGKKAIEESIDNNLKIRGPITHVVNNFGVNHLSWIGETEEYDEQILLDNVMAPYWVVNHLVKRGQTCRVINVASATYRVPQRCTAIYCASKAALIQMTKVMARELAPKGWVINAVSPGLMEDTKMAQMTHEQVLKLRGWSNEDAEEYAMKLIPMGRATNTIEIAIAIEKIFELPPYVNGAVIDIMGGV